MPLVLMAVTDPFVGGWSAATPLVYLSFLINVWIGTRLRSTENAFKIGAGVVTGSLVFFLLTNFAWLSGSSMYPHTLAGVVQCYAAAHPVLRPHPGERPALLRSAVRPARVAQPHGGALRARRRAANRIVWKRQAPPPATPRLP